MADTTTAAVNSQGALGDFLKPPVSPTPVTPAPRTDPALSPADSPSSSPAYQTPQTKPAPAVITATPATQTVNQMKTTLNTQTSGIQNQAVNNQAAATVKVQADQTAAQNKSLSDATAALSTPQTGATRTMGGQTQVLGADGNWTTSGVQTGATTADTNPVINLNGQRISLQTDGKYHDIDSGDIVNYTPPGSSSSSGQSQVDSLNQQVLDNQAKIDDAYNGYQTTLTQMQNGTLPLSPDQQTQIDATKVLFQQAHDALALTNKNYISGVGQTQVSNGLERYSPLMAMGEVQDAVTSSAQKLAELDAKNAQALGQLRLSFLTNNMDMAQKAYTAFQDYMKQKDDTLTNLADTAQKHLDTIVSQQQQQEQIDNAKAEQAKNDTYNQITKPIQDIATEAAKNGATKDILTKINGATDVASAINAAGDSLQTATGQLGDYLQYKRDAQANGQPTESYDVWKTADDKKQEQLKVSEAYGTAFASAKGKAAGEAAATGGSSSMTPVAGSNGVVYNVPADVAPYVKISPSGVKYVDASALSAAEKGKIITEAYNNGVNSIPVITDASANLDVSNIADATLKLQDMKNAFDPQVAGSAAQRDLYYAGAIKMASALQTNPAATGLDTYQDTALDILKAMSGTKGFRGGSSMVDSVKASFPQKTDTQAVVDQKIANMQKLIDDRQVSLIGKPSTSDQLLIDNNTAKNTINDYVKNTPQQAEQVAQLYTTPGATDASILQYMKAHPETYQYQYLQ